LFTALRHERRSLPDGHRMFYFDAENGPHAEG
jgi:hypothetical protein